jgi:methylmalonyl-CoA mutase N-terminal domain/subunit
MRERFGAKDERSLMLRFHVQTAGCSLTAQEPYNNVVRTAVEAMAAVMGGCQSLHTNSLDESYALPTEAAVRIALRTQQILAHECGLAAAADPLGGSYCVEALTDRLEAEAEEYFRRIEGLGGMFRAIETGFFRREIAGAAAKFQRDVDAGRRKVVGANCYEAHGDTPIELLRVDPAVEKEQCRRLAELRRRRDSSRVKRALEDLRAAAAGRENLMPRLVEGAHAYATLGEMVGVLREAFGEYTVRDRIGS